MDTEQVLTHDVLAAAMTLADNLLHAEPLTLFQQARDRLENDPDLSLLLQHLAQEQASLRQRQSEGNITQADIERLRALQRQVQASPIVMAYATAQQAAMDYLRGVNEEISQLLGVDFPTLANQNRSC